MSTSPDVKVSVVSIDKQKVKLENIVKVGQISQFRSIAVSERDTVTYWRYFHTGKGRMVPLKTSKFTSGLKEVSPFEHGARVSSNNYHTTNKRLRAYINMFYCPEDLCTGVFSNEDELDQHILTNNHVYLTPITLSDKAKFLFTHRLRANSIATHSRESKVTKIPISDCPDFVQDFFQPGWALSIRKTSNFTFKHWNFLYDLFMEGKNLNS